jgi:hypothetical protein
MVCCYWYICLIIPRVYLSSKMTTQIECCTENLETLWTQLIKDLSRGFSTSNALEMPLTLQQTTCYLSLNKKHLVI